MQTKNVIALFMVVGIFIAVAMCCCQNPEDLVSKSGNQTTFKGNASPTTTPASPTAPSTTSPTTSTSDELIDFLSPEIKARVSKGGQIHKRIESKYNLPIMFGWQGQDITFLVPTAEWNKMTKEDQINLTFYAQSLIFDIRENPVPFVDKWSRYYKRTERLQNGGEYDGLDRVSYLINVRKICGKCWKIAIGSARQDGFYDEDSPVDGKNVQAFRDAAKK